MSAKLIIYLSGKPLINGHKRRNFIWSIPHLCYIYKGKEIEADQFNTEFDAALKNAGEYLHPKVKVVSIENLVTSGAEDMTVDQAEAILQRFSPERLKKKPGPKTAATLEVG